MKKFNVPCDFNGKISKFTVYIGQPEDKFHPLHFQSQWLSKERGGSIPEAIMTSIAKLRNIASENNLNFEDLCVHAVNTATQEDGDKEEDSEDGEDNEDVEEKDVL